jgi:predicted alpha/beta superfamily hydrolase
MNTAYHTRRILQKLTQFLVVLGVATVAACSTAPPAPVISSGRTERLGMVPSQHVEPRLVDVWLPEDYSHNKRYSVLYMHDGQSIFDGATSFSKKGWHVDGALGRLLQEGRVKDTIVVAVWNTGHSRWAEYFAQKAVPLIEEPARSIFTAKFLQDKPRADDYLRFLVQELKPLIDKKYATRPDPANTAIMGSSMGGIISLYAMSEYPQVFGAAACLSTHWIGSFEQNTAIPLATFEYLRKHLPDPSSHRLYMDRGTTELDAMYQPHQDLVDAVVSEKGYTDANSVSLVFPGAGHNEVDWSKRLELPLIFLLGYKP